MDILFLGTGAADWPAPGKNVGNGRRCSSLLLDGHILIDCGQYAADAVEEFGVAVDDLTDIIISHPHSDHVDILELEKILRRRSAGLPPVMVHVNRTMGCALIPWHREKLLHLRVYSVDEAFDLGGGVHVQALPANHMNDMPGPVAAHLFLTTDSGETLLYLCDGSWLRDQAWQTLFAWHEKTGRSIDCVIWELTCGRQLDWRFFVGHCNIDMVRLEAGVLLKYGILRHDTAMLCSHIAHYLDDDHDSLAQAIAPDYLLAYDGMKFSTNK